MLCRAVEFMLFLNLHPDPIPKKWISWMGIYVVFIGLIVLFGWMVKSPILISVLPGWVAMKANTALCFVLSGCSLLGINSLENLSGKTRYFVQMAFWISTLGIILIAGVTACEYLIDYNLGIDQLFFPDIVQMKSSYPPGRMSPITAYNFLTISVVLILISTQRAYLIAQGLVISVAITTLAVITGTSYGLESLHASGHYVAVAIHTNLCFCLLSSGLLGATGRRGIMMPLSDQGPAGIILRVLLPAAIVIPLTITWCGTWFQKMGMFHPEFTASLVSFFTILIFTLVVWKSVEFLLRVEKKLGESYSHYNFLTDAIPQLLWMARPDGQLYYFNARWYDYTGLTPEPCRDNEGWLSVLHPDDRDHVLELWKIALCSGSTYEIKCRLKGMADGLYHWHLVQAQPYENEAHEIVHWVGTCTNIDAQIKANELLEATVRERTARLQSANDELEAFSYSITHDLRAPLRAMAGYSGMLLEDLGPRLEKEFQTYLQRIATACRRMDELILDVLAYSRIRQGDLVLKPIDPGKLIFDVAVTYPHLDGAHIDITIKNDLHLVLGHEAALIQCISNLLTNSIKFVSPEIKPRVEIWSEQSDDKIKIWFKDNGIGIAKNDLKKIFDIFHKVNPNTVGTGIGLSIVKKAVERMNGTIGVESEEGKGTAFWLELNACR